MTERDLRPWRVHSGVTFRGAVKVGGFAFTPGTGKEVPPKGVSRPTQSLWAKKLCEALHYYDFSEMEIVTVYLNHEYERSLTTE